MNPKDRSGLAKPNLSIIPLTPLYEVALALIEGARKYGPWNWRKEKVDETVYVDAAIRHLNQWLCGEDIDPDSGLPHISKAIAGLCILRDAQRHGCSIDTRQAIQHVDFPALSSKIADIVEKYPNPVSSDKFGAGLPDNEEPKYVTVTAEDWVQTRCCGGQSVLCDEDVNRKVRLRNGHEGFISGRLGKTYHVDIVGDDVEYTCQVNEFGRCVLSPNEGAHDPQDVAKVFRPVTRTVPNPLIPVHIGEAPDDVDEVIKWSDTVAGGGTYELTDADNGKKVEFRSGDTGSIYDFDDPIVDTIPAYAKTPWGDSCYSVEGRSENSDGEDENEDIVRVYH